MKQYYNQTDIKDVEAIRKDLHDNGFKTSTQVARCEIKRETSAYNKYMKWHMIQISDNGSHSSLWFKTKPEAIKHINSPRRPMPAGGDRMILRHLILKEE